jgi:hypothetical protein
MSPSRQFIFAGSVLADSLISKQNCSISSVGGHPAGGTTYKEKNKRGRNEDNAHVEVRPGRRHKEHGKAWKSKKKR